MSLDIHNWCKWLNCNIRKCSHDLCVLAVFLTGARLNNEIVTNI